MSAPTTPKHKSGILFEAGEHLREEVRQVAESMLSLVKHGRSEEWATGARMIGRDELRLPKNLIETLSTAQSWRLTDAELGRLQKYIEERRRAASGSI